jgi:hypothetical protein
MTFSDVCDISWHFLDIDEVDTVFWHSDLFWHWVVVLFHRAMGRGSCGGWRCGRKGASTPPLVTTGPFASGTQKRGDSWQLGAWWRIQRHWIGGGGGGSPQGPCAALPGAQTGMRFFFVFFHLIFFLIYFELLITNEVSMWAVTVLVDRAAILRKLFAYR